MRANSEVSKRYARALFELLPSGKADDALKQLRKLLAACEGPSIKDLVGSPVLSRSEKQIVISQLTANLNLSKEVEGLAKLLAAKDRVDSLADVVRAFEAISDEKNKVLRGTVSTATALTESEKEEVEAAIAKFTGYQLLLEYKEDPSLIGGLVAHVGSYTFDGTLNTQLTKLKEDINRRVN